MYQVEFGVKLPRGDSGAPKRWRNGETVEIAE